MEPKGNARYLVLANVNGKKTAIQLDGIYTILPPQNFPPQIPKEIQYQDERLPLYNARELIEVFEKKTSGQSGPYEQLYREFLGKVKEVSDDITHLKQNMTSSTEQDRSDSVAAASDIAGLTKKVQASQQKMGKQFKEIKTALDEIKKQEKNFFDLIGGLEGVINGNNKDLTDIMSTLFSHGAANQKLQKLVKVQEEMEDKLISILFHFGIKLRREENPDDAVIKRGEEMLNLLQGADKEAINQAEVDQLLAEFLK